MLGKLIPAVLALFGLVAGAGAGLFLRPAETHSVEAPDTAHAGAPAPEEHEAAASHGGTPTATSAPAQSDGKLTHDYVKFNNQFVVPVVQTGRVSALVILSISLEVLTGTSEKVYQVEPKLRDGFLQVLFDHANAGGFLGTFTDGSNMVLLRKALLEVARSTLGENVTDVLIVDIVRQDN